MTIDEVNLSTEGEGDELLYTGDLLVNMYHIVGEDRDVQVDVDLDDIDTGVDNVFTSAGGGSVSKFSGDNGDAIRTDYDLYIALNPTTSDTSGKLVGLNSGSDNLTSSKNETEAVSMKVTKGDDGTYTVEYSIGTETKSKTFDPGEDLTLLIQSSDLKDESDVNKINLTIENTSDKTLYVKIAGDETAQRVKIVNRAGSINVYR